MVSALGFERSGPGSIPGARDPIYICRVGVKIRVRVKGVKRVFEQLN